METGNYVPPRPKEEVRIIEKEVPNYAFYGIVLFFLAILVMGGIFLYEVSNGMFKPEIQQPIDTHVNSTTSNQFDFTPSTQNTYNNFNNYTIINNYTILNNNYIYTNHT